VSENIENVIWYSIGAFDYFITREHHEGPSSILQEYTTKREYILSEKDEELIQNQIASFKYTDDVLSTKRVEIKKNFQGRPIFKDHNAFENRQVKFIFKLFEKGDVSILDALLLDISNRISDECISTDSKLFEKILMELSSFCYLHLIDDLELGEVLKYQSKALVILNKIIDSNEELFSTVDEVKQKLYPLIRNSIFELFQDDNKKSDILIFIKPFEILDLFTIFDWSLQLFPITLIEYLMNELIKDNKRDAWPVNRYHCLKMFLLDNFDPLNEEYFKLYDKYFTLENDNAFLMMALRAQYKGNIPLSKEIYKKIDEDLLNEFFYRQYDDLCIALESSDEIELKTYKNKDEILAIIELGDRAKFEEYLNEFDTSTLSGYCLNECTRYLLSNKVYNAIEIEVILYKNPTSLYSYLSKSSEYIKDQDIASLYILTTILLNLNLINESYILLKRIIERIDCENAMVIDTLKLQLLITKKFLGYIV
jgi:hypothetical protein